MNVSFNYSLLLFSHVDILSYVYTSNCNYQDIGHIYQPSEWNLLKAYIHCKRMVHVLFPQIHITVLDHGSGLIKQRLLQVWIRWLNCVQWRAYHLSLTADIRFYNADYCQQRLIKNSFAFWEAGSDLLLGCPSVVSSFCRSVNCSNLVYLGH